MTETPAEIDQLIGAEAPLRVWVERRSHSVTNRVAVMGVGVGALIVLDLWWLVVAPIAAFAWSLRRPVAGEAFALVVELEGGSRRAFLSNDRRALKRTAEQLRGRCPAIASQRLVFLDVMRALAIGAMVFAHFTDQLLDPALHSTAFGSVYLATRGFTAPLFFLVSGWSFAAAVMPKVAHGTADFPRRLRRGGLLLLWGYLLTLPWWAEGFPFTESTQVWMPFWTAGVLQTLGGSLLLATVLLWSLRKPVVFLAVSLGVAVVAMATADWALAHAAAWPAAVRGYFDPQGNGGGFPVTPWSAYFFGGIALGGGLWLRRAKSIEVGLVLMGVAGAAGLAQGLMVAPLQLFVWRFAWVTALLGVAALVTSTGRRLPFAVRTLGQHALTFYVAHMVLLWGAPKFPGLVHRFRPELGWLACVGLTAGCLGITGFGIWLLARTKKQALVPRVLRRLFGRV